MSVFSGDVVRAKEKIRKKVWNSLTRNNLAIYPRPCKGSIPAFRGILYATTRLTRLSAFKDSQYVFSSIDHPLALFRAEVLRRGKVLVTSSPGLRNGLLIVRPENVRGGLSRRPLSFRPLLRWGELIRSESDLAKLGGVEIGFVAISSLAVTSDGARLGDGRGLGDFEFAVLRELKLLRRDSVVATLVHDEQFVEEIPMELHDVPVDFIATPSRLIKVEQKYPKPLGLIRDKITIDFLDKMPFLRVFISFSP